MSASDTPNKTWFSNSSEAIRWIRDEARQWYSDNPKVAAHLFETATIFETELTAAQARIAELEQRERDNSMMVLVPNERHDELLTAEQKLLVLKRELTAAQARIAELELDAARLSWIEENETLHKRVDILYVVDGYEVQLMHEDGFTELSKAFHGENLRSAIDAAMTEPK